MKYDIRIQQKLYPVEITFKEIKALRLKVFPNTEIKLSVPSGTPENFIADFLESKRSWIEKQLDLFKQTAGVEREQSIKTGTSTRILGRQLCIKIVYAAKKTAMYWY